MQLVHSIWLSEDEIQLIADHNAIVVHCPVSNMYLASGIAPIPELLKAGVRVALGTDGPGSNNSQDMMETLKTTALLHKVNTLNAHILLPEDVLWMACRGGAEAFGLPEQIGSLEPGKKADVVIGRPGHADGDARASGAVGAGLQCVDAGCRYGDCERPSPHAKQGDACSSTKKRSSPAPAAPARGCLNGPGVVN
jgi:cytosine/adenosine deaminase-related metal-dependent hydrolase